jgi:type I pantothenate kinase
MVTQQDAKVPPQVNRGYLEFDRDQWASFRDKDAMSLSSSEMESLISPFQSMAPEEVRDILLPLSHLLNLHAAAKDSFDLARTAVLGTPVFKPPYVIGISGSVAVGKSSFARLLSALLSHWPSAPKVQLVTTDSFLFPLSMLKERNCLHRKGFPESYDKSLFLDFLNSMCKEGKAVQIPVYSHVRYDILINEMQQVQLPDILILEGLNVLQGDEGFGLGCLEFIDFSIYIDAPTDFIKKWYLERFVYLKNTAFQSTDSYFNKFKKMSDLEALSMASDTWDQVNLKNLVEHILPTRDRASLIIHKSSDHSIDRLQLRAL